MHDPVKTAPSRLLVTLPDEDRAWLAAESERRDVSMAGVIREAIGEYRSHRESNERLRLLLDQTFGTWTKGDALEYVAKLRDEWER